MKVAIVVLVALLVSCAIAHPFSNRPKPRITNGEDAERGQFPYQVSYQWGLLGTWQHVCGGTIISPNFVLTAGHCVTQVPAYGDFRIIAGILDLSEDTPDKQVIKVVERTAHPDFGGDVGPNDVAVLRLETPLEWNDSVQPLALPSADSDPTGRDAVLSGWGSISTIVLPIMPERLQTVTIPVLGDSDCNTAIEKLMSDGEENPYDLQSNICTGPLDQKISACSGDSGGPLAQDKAIIGIVSWGMMPCGSPGAPSVFTRVSNFVDWIKENTDIN